MKDYARELRRLPQVDRIITRLQGDLPHALTAEAARAAVEEARATVLSGAKAPTEEAVVERARILIRVARRRRLVRIINATGVLLHTNLGRAPLGSEALNAIGQLASGYSNLEFDLERGSRGSRYAHSAPMLTALTGAEAALVVNNNAAAVLLALATLARDKEVVISRGELIEIGGGFRIPEILAESGAVLVEVGTTNRTHLTDYQHAVGAGTGAVMKVHPSNYRVTGFASAVQPRDLAMLAHARDLPLIYDLGSGLLRKKIAGVEPFWLSEEPTVEEALADGADVVTFSGDKLLGGPQAGIILGRKQLVAAMHRSPLLRAFRVDKTTLAALEATLVCYLEGREGDIPVWKMALADVTEIEDRATGLRRALEGVSAKVDEADGSSTPGGGSVPGGAIPTVLVEIAPQKMSPDELVRALIDEDPPIVARIDDDRVVIDLRTVHVHDDRIVAASLQRLLE